MSTKEQFGLTTIFVNLYKRAKKQFKKEKKTRTNMKKIHKRLDTLPEKYKTEVWLNLDKREYKIKEVRLNLDKNE